jgi:hypothetical protein
MNEAGVVLGTLFIEAVFGPQPKENGIETTESRNF